MSEEATVEVSQEASVEAPAETPVEAAAEATPEAAAAEAAVEAPAAPEVPEELSYHAVQKDGNITAIWEMRGRKHIRTIDPRSEEGRHLLGHHDEPEAAQQ